MIEEVFGFAEIFAVWFYLVVTAFMFVDMLRGGGFMVNMILSPLMIFAAFLWPFTAGMIVIFRFLHRKPEGIRLEHPEKLEQPCPEDGSWTPGCVCIRCMNKRTEHYENSK